MGQGIAQVTASAGFPTRLYDIDEARVTQSLTSIRAQLEKLVGKGKIDASARDSTISRLSAASDLTAACTGAHVVIEAVPEDMGLKTELFRVAMKAAASDALLGSNTSSL